MGQAKRRQQFLQSLLSSPVLRNDLYFVFDRCGVVTILVVKPGNEGLIEVAFFCLDDWQEGLFQCLGRTYNAIGDFQSDFQPKSTVFKPALKDVCWRRVARGVEIRHRANALLPPEFFFSPAPKTPAVSMGNFWTQDLSLPKGH